MGSGQDEDGGGESLEEPLFEEGQEISSESESSGSGWLETLEMTPEAGVDEGMGEIPPVPEPHPEARPAGRRLVTYWGKARPRRL